jgi:competence protein ComEC
MAERGKARGRAETWDVAGKRRAAGAWPSSFAQFRQRLAEHLQRWAMAEVAPGRLVPWLAVAFGTGIVLYFTAETEPAWWAASALAVGCTVIAILARRRPIAFPLLLALTSASLGLAMATVRTLWISHPVLQYPTWNAELAGYVEMREERARSDRIVIRVYRVSAPRLRQKLERVRVAVRKGTAPAVGAFVELKARLNPPLPPLRPGGYDFARDMYFQRLGASGFVLGKVRTVAPPAPPDLRLRAATVIQGLRDAIDARIRTSIPGNQGAIASALITGKRNAISPAVYDAFYVSSLAHVLAISGFHMAVVAGIVFFLIRGGFALIPSLASRRPIKKWAAAGALAAAAFYLVLSGAGVATQRSFVMIALVLVGVMADRQALTLRTLTIAALAVLLLSPQAVVHPSFQMSFAATLALIAGYERGLPWMTAGSNSSFGARVALWGGREIAGLVLASLLAGLATTPYAAFHFHRLAPYGVIANLAAMPIVSAWVMPAGILAVIALPFGFDGALWQLMGRGIDWMITVALWVAQLPGALGRIPAFGTGALLIVTLGLIVICLLKTPLRWCGVLLVVLGCVLAVHAPRPDILVAADGQAIAVRGADGRLSFARQRRDNFAVREWLAADADPRIVDDKALAKGVACDDIGCIARLADGRLVAFARAVDAFEEDCTRAAVVVSPLTAPGACAARLIDRKVWRARGAMALRWDGGNFKITAARPPRYDRPWAGEVRNSAITTRRRTPTKAGVSRDATPRAQNLQAGD